MNEQGRQNITLHDIFKQNIIKQNQAKLVGRFCILYNFKPVTGIWNVSIYNRHSLNQYFPNYNEIEIRFMLF